MSLATENKQENIASESKQKNKISPFLKKLYKIIQVCNILYYIIFHLFLFQDQNNNDIIIWNEEGNGFIILDYKRFIKELLSTNFKTDVFSSFIRQLNIYDFHKIKQSNANILEFVNKNFLKDIPEKMSLIKRKIKVGRSANLSKKEDPSQALLNNNNTIMVKNKLKLFKENLMKVKRLNLAKTQQKLLGLKKLVNELKRKVEITEGKYVYLEFCHNELEERNKKAKVKLQNSLDKKKNLQHLFVSIVKNFFPNMKLIDNNNLTNVSIKNPEISNNQIIDLSMNLNLNNSELVSLNPKANNKGKIFQLFEKMGENDKPSPEENELKALDQINEYGKNFLKDLDNTANFSNKKELSQDQELNSSSLLDNDKSNENSNSYDKQNTFLNKKKKRDKEYESLESDGVKDLL